MMESIKQQVEMLLEQEPQLLSGAMAKRLGVSEFEVVAALPKQMVGVTSGDQAQSILEGLVGFGPVTTIVQSFGSIFEVMAPFPKGKVAHGYYNLMGKNGELHGHLNLENVKNVALVSRISKGRESHYFGFFSECGSNIFKIYLGRDKKRELIKEQVTAFRAMQAKLNK